MAKITAIAWIPYHRRTELLAQHLGASLHFVQYGEMENVFQAPFRYAAQAVRTWRILKAERPDVVLVQNPPILAVLLASVYARRHGGRYIIDSHTGAFLSWKWRWSRGLHRLLSRNGLTLVHNRSQEQIVGPWGCAHLVVAYTPGDYARYEPFPLAERFSVAVVSSLRDDERPDLVFAAAGRLPDVDFYVTGNSARLAPDLLAQKPGNCHLTGYLPYEQYVGLLHGADAIMALTSRDDTLLMGGFEAVSVGRPLITSDWPVLRDYFCQGTVHVPLTADGICQGVRHARAQNDLLRQDMHWLRRRLDAEWAQNLAAIRRFLSVPTRERVLT